MLTTPALPSQETPKTRGLTTKPNRRGLTAVPMTADEEKKLGELLRMEKGKPAATGRSYGPDRGGKRTNAYDPRYANGSVDFAFTGAGRLRLLTRTTRSSGSTARWPSTPLPSAADRAADDDGQGGHEGPGALYLPTMVHESEHQNQTARAMPPAPTSRNLQGQQRPLHPRQGEPFQYGVRQAHDRVLRQERRPRLLRQVQRHARRQRREVHGGGVEADTSRLYPRA